MPQPLSLRSLRPGEFFGELSMFDKQPRSASAVATADTVLLELRHDAFESYLSKRPRVAMTIFRTMSLRLRETNSMLSGQAARNVDEEFDRNLTWSDRLADAVAKLNGSWTFISILLTITFLWCAVNSFLALRTPPDPYPYQLFNLLLGILVGLQGPLIMMSQNRQGLKDRARRYRFQGQPEERAQHRTASARTGRPARRSQIQAPPQLNGRTTRRWTSLGRAGSGAWPAAFSGTKPLLPV
jgi:hypothetical protein